MQTFCIYIYKTTAVAILTSDYKNTLNDLRIQGSVSDSLCKSLLASKLFVPAGNHDLSVGPSLRDVASDFDDGLSRRF